MPFFQSTKTMKPFFILWFGQFLSGLGSCMTGFAITIWAYQKTGSALALSISGFLIFLPRVVGGLCAGPFIDRWNKKKIILFTDIGAGISSLSLFFLLRGDHLAIWHIYCFNFISGLLISFQGPASDVAMNMLVAREDHIKTNGMRSFADGAVQILSPMLAALALSMVGMPGVIIFDLITLVFACITLLLFIDLPRVTQKEHVTLNMRQFFIEFEEGYRAIGRSSSLTTLLVFIMLIDILAGMTYYNLLSPMILARSNQSTQILALCNGAIGVGSLLGGILVTLLPSAKKKLKAIFISAAASFLLGDILLALGKSPFLWAVAAFLSSVLLPVLGANDTYLWRVLIPTALQGRALSCKRSLQGAMLCIGMLLGGLLADGVFEPFMMQDHPILTLLVGSGKGAGMALMFLLSGCIGTVLCVLGYLLPSSEEIELNSASEAD